MGPMMNNWHLLAKQTLGKARGSRFSVDLDREAKLETPAALP